MHCITCGEKLSLRYYEGEGLVPYCSKCEKYKFPPFSCAVCMVIYNRAQDKILLAKHLGDESYMLFAGYIKKSENAEKAVIRECNEETGLNAVKYRYLSSQYFEDKNTLMLCFTVMLEDGEIVLNKAELENYVWVDVDDAPDTVLKGSNAESFLRKALPEIKKKK